MSSEEEPSLPKVEDESKAASNEVDESAPSAKRTFDVQRVNFDVEPSVESETPPSEQEQADDERAGAPDSPHGQPGAANDSNFTMGYATNEAVPMTMFYRNDTTHGAKQRPTLQQLREGPSENKVCLFLSALALSFDDSTFCILNCQSLLIGCP